MARLRRTLPGEKPNKQRFKRKMKMKKWFNRGLLILSIIYLTDKVSVIEFITELYNKFLQ